MLKVTINSLQGQKLATPMVVFIKTRINVDAEKNRLICSFTQSDTQDGTNNVDYVGFKRGAVIQDNPSLPAKATDLIGMGETIVKNWIVSLNLPQVVSTDSI
jgi:hypothetical protein